MKFRFAAVATALFIAQCAQAQTLSVPQSGELANTTTPAASSKAYDALLQRALAGLRHAIQGDAAALTRGQLAKSAQTNTQADRAWLKASGYDFRTKENQQADLALLGAFSTLPDNVLQASLATVTAINRDATQAERQQALADAEGINHLYFLAGALGPKLGNAFLTAYDKGELGKAAALIKASEVSTSVAKKHFNYPRPFLAKGNTIHLVPDDVIVKDNVPYTADGGAFPSGHTNTGYTDALLLAEMVPERFAPLVEAGARYGYSRLVLGVHYPLDVMGSRMVAQRNVANYLNDPRYRALFIEARDQLRTALEKECGTTLQACAKNDAKDDPWVDPAIPRLYAFTMTYDLPRQSVKATPVNVPDGAEVLLEYALPKLSAAKRRALMQQSALPAGYPLSGDHPEQQFWQRLDLTAAFALAKSHSAH